MELRIQSYREIAIVISRRYLRGSQAFSPDEKDEDEINEDDTIMNEQTEHGSHVAGMIYAREIMKRVEEVHSKRERFRASSETWHRFLRFEGVSVKSEMKRETPFDQEMMNIRAER